MNKAFDQKPQDQLNREETKPSGSNLPSNKSEPQNSHPQGIKDKIHANPPLTRPEDHHHEDIFHKEPPNDYLHLYVPKSQ